ncbi:hypothetical protein GSI_04696 [Ganoderma sinense ZZ0214-1]|uniref:Uncharacterized protein n=1 Tax=Ganoderma sinense ZZ0214-1 TaxID=1077348 RepID=A0A2G8SHJ9_9APHY|nr:hypothetical protein GSI_04696 [Ganoderma sinense ZZ0214-1]
MSTCRARFSPSNSRVSPSSLRPSLSPPSPTDTTTPPWRPPPHPCNVAYPPIPGSLQLDNLGPADLRAKSTPPGDQHRPPRPVYPSPPLTDAALASTIPLPDVPGEPLHKQECPQFREGVVDGNMSHDGAQHFTPLSPPPTVFVGPSELPEGEPFQDGGHQVESWSYGEDPQDGGVCAPLFPPVRDDSGFEEFGTQGGCGADPRFEGSQENRSLIEPTSIWIPHSPLSMDEILPLGDLSSLHGVAPALHGGDQSSGHSNGLVSPISPSGTGSNTDSWSSGSVMDWTYSPSSTLVNTLSLPPSPKPSGLSLELPELDTSLGFQPHHALPLQQPSPLSPVELPFGQSGPHWFPGDTLGAPLGKTSPSNEHAPLPEDHDPFFPFTHSSLLRPPSADLDSEYPDSIMPSEDDESPPSSPRRRPLNDLHDTTPPHGDILLTPIPRSPHLPLADLDMDDPAEAPCSPHSPHALLPELDGEDEQQYPPITTIAPSLLGGAPEPQPQHAGLGLFLQSDPPLARSPSPDDDDFGFLDIQLDPESANVEVDEFLALRAMRKNALAQERAARMAETELSERITVAASALLPPSHADADSMDVDAEPVVLDVAEKRVRKRELHALMDMRTEARRTRKLQKQRSKEIGALLDFKMHSPMSPMEGLPPLVIGGGGKGWTKTIAHLVAHMVLRRHDRSRPLENKPPAPQIRSPTSLRRSLSAEDLSLLSSMGVAGGDEDGDDDMEM